MIRATPMGTKNYSIALFFFSVSCEFHCSLWLLGSFVCGEIFEYLNIGKVDKDCTHFFGVTIEELQAGVVAKRNSFHKQLVNHASSKGLMLLIYAFNVTNDGS